MKFNWQKIRIPLLSLTFGSVLLVLGKVVLFPLPGKPKLSSFTFPSEVPLPQWQQSKIQFQPNSEETQFIAQKHYRYKRNNSNLDIEMRYLTLPGGNFSVLLGDNKPALSSSIERYRDEVGFYLVGIENQQRAYLSTCINPRGGATLTFTQYMQNRYLHDLQPQRLVSWLLGKEELLDKRCLWAHMSVPIKDYSSPKVAVQTLENAWLSWYKWWQPRFPKP
ncbi:MAG: cyanoexosortase A system-associated protein [Cyanobacteria bacterium J06621_15]